MTWIIKEMDLASCLPSKLFNAALLNIPLSLLFAATTKYKLTNTFVFFFFSKRHKQGSSSRTRAVSKLEMLFFLPRRRHWPKKSISALCDIAEN